jgi:hypothetical protein
MHAGYDPAYNTNKRRPRKNYKNARLTLAALRSKLLQAIIDHNTRNHKGYQLHPNDIRDGVLAIPVSIYVRGMARHGRPSTFEEHEVRFHLLPQDTAVVHQDGISYGGAMYVCTDVIHKGWHTKAAGGNPFEIDIRHLPGIVDSIYVIDYQDPSVYYLASLKSSHKEFAGMSRAELLNLEHVGKQNAFRGDRHNADMRVVRLDQHTEEGLFQKTEPAVKRKDMSKLRTADQQRDRSETLALPAPPGAATAAAPYAQAPASGTRVEIAGNAPALALSLSLAPAANEPPTAPQTATPPAAEPILAPPSASPQPQRGSLAAAARDRLLARLKEKANA